MMYILSEDEISSLVSIGTYRKDLENIEDRLKKCEDLILSLSDFICIHDAVYPIYCDKCPLGILGIKTCNKEQKYSK